MAKPHKCWLGAAIGIILLCGVGGYTGFGIPESDYNRELEQAEAVGLPSQPEKYQRVVADADNAAPFYRKAFSEWESFSQKNPEIASNLGAGRVSTAYGSDAARRDFAKIRHIFQLLDMAAEKPSLTLNHLYAGGALMDVPEFTEMKTFVKLRAFYARALARKSDFKGAYRELEQCAAIPRQMGQDNPTLIVLLVQIALRSIVLRTLEQTLCQHGRSPVASAAGLRVIDALGSIPNYRTAVRGEYALALGTMNGLADAKQRSEFLRSSNPDAESQTSHRLSTEEVLLGLPSFRYQMMAPVVRFYRTSYRQLPTDPEAVPELLRLDRILEAQYPAKNWPTDYLLGMMVLPVSIAPAVAKTSAEEKLIRLLAINLGRPGGVWIPPNFPHDPFSDKPFGSKITKDGFRIWSTGRNGVDDGGVILSNGDMSGDIVVGYPYVEKSIRWVSSPSGAPTGLPAGSPP